MAGETCEVYKDKAGEWRWRVKAANGQIIASAHEGYKNRQDCVNNAHKNGWNMCK